MQIHMTAGSYKTSARFEKKPGLLEITEVKEKNNILRSMDEIKQAAQKVDQIKMYRGRNNKENAMCKNLEM